MNKTRPIDIGRNTWLSNLPVSWNTSQFKHVFQIVKEFSNEVTPQVLSLTQQGVIERDVTNNEGQLSSDYSQSQSVQVGDFVLNPMDLLSGWVAISSFSGVTSNAYFVFRPKKDQSTLSFDPRFFQYVLQMYYKSKILEPFGKGVGRPENGGGRWTLNRETLNSIPLPVPPLNEQKAIADFLDRELAQIDPSIEKLNKVVLNLDERQRSLIWSMVTKSLNDNSGVKYSGLSWITDVPSHWEIRKVAGIHKFVTGGTPNSSNQEFYNGTYPWITIADLNGGEIRETKSALSEAGVKAANLKMVPKGALLFSFKLSVGQVAFTGLDCYTNEAIAAFIPNEVIHQRWAFYTYPVFLIQNANWNIYGARLMNTSLIRGARILLPPIKEQETIATILDQKLEEIQRLRNKCQASAELLYDRRQSLVSAAVTGKLDVQKVA